MAPKTVASPSIGRRSFDHPMSPEIIIISPIRFGRGGSPNLAAQAISHHIGSRVVTDLNPRVINILRVCVRS